MAVFKPRGKIWALGLSVYVLPPTLKSRGLRLLYWSEVILSRPVDLSGVPPVALWYFWNASEGDSRIGSGLGDCERAGGPTCRDQHQCCPRIDNPSGLGQQWRLPIAYTLVNSPKSACRTRWCQWRIIHWSDKSVCFDFAERQGAASESLWVRVVRFKVDSNQGLGDGAVRE